VPACPRASPPGVVGDRQARDIGDVLAERLFAIDGDVGEGPVSVELCDQTRARCLEVREVTLGPPVPQPPAGVEQRSLVIETMADLMSMWRRSRRSPWRHPARDRSRAAAGSRPGS